MANETPLRRTCGTMDVHRRLADTDATYRQNRLAIESYARRATLRTLDSGGRTGPIVIPVVAHVVYHSADQNISDAQIFSQLKVLNEDFRKRNADAVGVPGVFQPLAADAQIEFRLAVQDPNGSPTTGITRTPTNVTTFDDISETIKAAATGGHDPWPRDSYLNLWVGPEITDPVQGALLGYAQFPGGPAATDGVVIWHAAFGTLGTATPPFHKGRTATHEIGHWLDLLHIWGDDDQGCTRSDEVADTPNQAGPNQGAPVFPHVSCSNGPNGDMFMNYMDYSDDASMGMFTRGQSARMDAAISGPRAALLNSVGLAPTVATRPVNPTLGAEPMQVFAHAQGEVGDPSQLTYNGITWVARSG